MNCARRGRARRGVDPEECASARSRVCAGSVDIEDILGEVATEMRSRGRS